ncbi:GNAT family protein, partial [Nocardioides sp.]|uniref:GNAT family N-acetyltransferase n=1 Tax=Nocardioides sp. TaxID=35761 RepID=UPI001A2ABA86
TDRLTLRPATPEDLRAVYAIRSLPEVGQWMPDLPASYDAWVLAQGRRGGLERMLVVLLGEEVIGHLYLHVEDAWSQVEVRDQATRTQAEVGWAFDPRHQGQGYATEAVRELLRLCFEELGVRRVVALAFADNAPSLRVMEKVGMRREALLVKESLHRELGWLDGVSYALLAEEWLSAP